MKLFSYDNGRYVLYSPNGGRALAESWLYTLEKAYNTYIYMSRFIIISSILVACAHLMQVHGEIWRFFNRKTYKGYSTHVIYITMLYLATEKHELKIV